MNLKDRIALSLKLRAENPNLTPEEFEREVRAIDDHDKAQKEHYDRRRILTPAEIIPFTDQLF